MPAPQFTIREAVPQDAEQIAIVQMKTWQSAYAGIFPEDRLAALDQDLSTRTERWQANIANPDNLPAFYVAETQDGEIVGFAGAGKQNKADFPYDAELFVIYILPEHQGQGLGRRLISATAARLQALGFSSLLLWVLEDNPSSRGFYKKLGGKLIGRDEYLRWDETYTIVAYAWDSLTPFLND